MAHFFISDRPDVGERSGAPILRAVSAAVEPRDAPKRIGFIGFDGVTALDLIGPMEAFAAADVVSAGSPRRCRYELVVLGLSPRPFVAESGVSFRPDRTLRLAPPLDTLVIPGGRGLRDPETNRTIAEWLRDNAGQFRRVISICTGIYALAPTGLLDGRRVTTHWRHARDVAERFPGLRMEADALFVQDGPYHTSAGVTAGIDLALSLIEDDLGSEIALAVARELVTYLERPGGQQQFSEPGPTEPQADARFAELARWIEANLTEDLSIEALARRFELSPRHFTRLFTRAFGRPPAFMIEDLRLDAARRKLIQADATVEGVASAVGFRNPDTFRRTFQRRIGVSPSYYRHRFRPRVGGVRGAGTQHAHEIESA